MWGITLTTYCFHLEHILALQRTLTLRMVQSNLNPSLTLEDFIKLLRLDLAILDEHVMELDDPYLIFLGLFYQIFG
jgi:hypothetical protein